MTRLFSASIPNIVIVFIMTLVCLTSSISSAGNRHYQLTESTSADSEQETIAKGYTATQNESGNSYTITDHRDSEAASSAPVSISSAPASISSAPASMKVTTSSSDISGYNVLTATIELDEKNTIQATMLDDFLSDSPDISALNTVLKKDTPIFTQAPLLETSAAAIIYPFFIVTGECYEDDATNLSRIPIKTPECSNCECSLCQSPDSASYTFCNQNCKCCLKTGAVKCSDCCACCDGKGKCNQGEEDKPCRDVKKCNKCDCTFCSTSQDDSCACCQGDKTCECGKKAKLAYKGEGYITLSPDRKHVSQIYLTMGDGTIVRINLSDQAIQD
ncbi:hypothetical protein ACWJJH_04485 [Endozoicomonadaceae bacterium StTr2]